jgi:hypothetical protein
VRVTISGRAFVVRDGDDVRDAAILRRFHDVVYDDEVFTDHLGDINLDSVQKARGPKSKEFRQAKLENGVREALESGGSLRLVYEPAAKQLWVRTEYTARQALTPEELTLLADYTRGQWSDGIGENFQEVSAERYGLCVDCSRVGQLIVEQT